MSAASSIIEITKMITNNDKMVIGKVSSCVEDIKKYFEDHREQYSDRGIDDFEEEEESVLCWLGMVDILDENGYVCERDYKDEKEDFVYFVNGLKGMSDYDLCIEEEWLDEDEGINEWAEILDDKWAAGGCCLASIDIDGDCFVLFPAKVSEMETLNDYAETAGYRIDYAANM